MTDCETCFYYVYNEETDDYSCEIDMDMDEAERFLSFTSRGCPFYNPGDEYSIVKKQN